MSLNAIHNMRVQNVRTQEADAPANDQQAAAAEQGIDALFGQDASTSSQPADGALASFMVGDLEASAQSAESNSLDNALANGDFPPTVEEILVGNPKADGYLDIVVGKYAKTIEKLEQMKVLAEQAMRDPSISLDEAARCQARIAAIDTAITKAQEQTQLATQRMSGNEELYTRERFTGEDYNDDGWIGRPGSDLSVRVMINHEGKKVYLDPKIDKAIQNPFLAPNYQAQLSFGNGVVMNEDPDGHNTPIDVGNTDIFNADGTYKDRSKKADLNLHISPEAANRAQQRYGSTMEMGVPEFLWVKREEEGFGPVVTAEYGKDSEGEMTYGDEHLELYKEWDTTNGVAQKVPEDKQAWMQVKVTRVEAESEIAGWKANGTDPLYHQVIRYYGKVDDKEVLIATVKVEGVVADGEGAVDSVNASLPAGEQNQKYIAASTLGITFTGRDGLQGTRGGRVSPVKLDLGGLESTGSHAIPNIEDAEDGLGIKKTDGLNTSYEDGISQELRADRSWNETVGLFQNGGTSFNFFLTYSEAQQLNYAFKKLHNPNFEDDALGAPKYTLEVVPNPNGSGESYLKIKETGQIFPYEQEAFVSQVASDNISNPMKFEDLLRRIVEDSEEKLHKAFESAASTSGGDNGNSSNIIPIAIKMTIADAAPTDRYVSKSEAEDSQLILHSSMSNIKTGAIIDELTGNLKGTKYNDVFNVPDHDRDFADSESLKAVFGERPDYKDPAYQTVIDAGDGTDMVKAGHGNVFARSVAFFWGESNLNDKKVVELEKTVAMANGNKDTQADVKNFVYQKGGKIDILNDVETDGSDLGEAENFDLLTRNDFYHFENTADVSFANGTDQDIDDSSMRDGIDWNTTYSTEVMDKMIEELDEVIEGLPALDEADMTQAVADWNLNYGKNYSEMESELGQFFGEMFGNEEEDQQFADEQREIEEDLATAPELERNI